VRHEIETELVCSNIYFGATSTRLFVGHPVSPVPISRVRCSKCPRASPAEYVAWGDTNAPEADRREASALLAELVEKDHPRHKAVYSGMTLEELRQRVGRKASSTGSYSNESFDRLAQQLVIIHNQYQSGFGHGPSPRSGYERSKEFASMGARWTDRWSPPQTSSVPISSRLTSYRGGNVTMVARLVYWTLVV